MRRQVLATAMAAACALGLTGLTGCSDESTAAPPPTTHISPTTTATSPTTAPPPTTTAPTSALPVLPSQARQKSVAGAKAFVRFYIDAVNSSIQPRSTEVLRHFSTKECVTCRGIASSMDMIRRNHGYYRGGDWLVTATSPVPLQTPNRPIVHTAITVEAGEWKRSSTDHVRKIGATKIYIDMHLAWSRSNWVVTGMVQA